jgi:hypothetical protein
MFTLLGALVCAVVAGSTSVVDAVGGVAVSAAKAPVAAAMGKRWDRQ